MQFDLLAAIELTVCAAIAISVLSIGFGQDAPARLRITVWLTAWFGVVATLGATKALYYKGGLGAPGLGLAVMLPIVVVIARVLRSPSLRRGLDAIPLHVLIGVHAIRVLGVTFLILYGAGRLPAPFAPLAGWGDVLTGLAAAPIAWLAYRQLVSRRTVLLWNTFGLLDLIVAIGLGAISAPGVLRLMIADPGSEIMTLLPWLLIPGFIVPLLATTHIAVFYRLRIAAPRAVRSDEGISARGA